MAQNTDINDIRRQKQRMRLLKQLLIVLFVVLSIIFIYANRNKWFPKLEGIGGKYESAMESSGSFPISISGGSRYQIEKSGDSLVVLGNTSFKVYSANGNMTANFQHAYTTPVLETSQKRILVFDHGGVKFRVDAKNKSIYEKTLDGNILLARVSDEGYAAVVTTSDMYVCMLYVYDDNGKNIYTRGCTEKITDISFCNSSSACYAVSVDVSSGQLISQIQYFEFFESDSEASSEPSDSSDTSQSINDSSYGVNSATLALETVFFEDGGYVVIGDTMTIYYDAQGKSSQIYSYDDALIAYQADSSGKVALLFENTDMRCANLVLMEKGSRDTVLLNLPQSSSCISISDGEVYTCVDGAVMSYKFDGTLSKNIGTNETGSDVVIIEDYIYLLGYDKIERIDSLSAQNQKSEGN